MKNNFFIPFKGKNYECGVGTKKKKILVIGASFYCPYINGNDDCKKCTDINLKDSSPYDKECKIYKSKGKTLHNEPTYSIENETTAYKRFATSISKFVGTDDYEKIWSHLLFTNYVQFILPVEEGKKYRETKESDLSPRDFNAFLDVVTELKPDIVIVWGCVVNTPIKNNKYLIDKKELIKTDGYVCHLSIPNIDHKICIINSYHPSSKHYWYNNLKIFQDYLSKQLML